MNSNFDNKEIIDRYLNGQLSGSSLADFKRKLYVDEELMREVVFQKALIRGLKQAGRKEWTAKLEAFHQEMNVEQANQQSAKINFLNISKKFNYKKYTLPVAASVALIIICAAVFRLTNAAAATDKIFATYYRPSISVEQGSREYPYNPSAKNMAFAAYNSGRYPESIELFNQVLAKQEDGTVLFYLGNADLSAGKTQDAEIAFKKYLNRYAEFADESKWYLALTYLKQRKVNKAKPLLQELGRGRSDYSIKSIEILSKL